MASNFQLSSSVVLDLVDNDFIALETGSGQFYHYTPETESFIRLFEEPRDIEDLLNSRFIPSTEVPTVLSFLTHLTEAHILIESSVCVPFGSTLENSIFVTPKLTGTGEKSFDEVAHLEGLVTLQWL